MPTILGLGLFIKLNVAFYRYLASNVLTVLPNNVFATLTKLQTL